MKIKRYVVREMQEAIQLIKKDLGPEAIIVSSYKVPAKGLFGLFMPRLLEVTAALDDGPRVKLEDVSCPPAQMAVQNGNAAQKRVGPARKPARALTAGSGRAGFFRAGSVFQLKKEEELSAGLPDRLSSGFDVIYNKQVEAGLNADPVLRWRKILLDMDIEANIVEHLLSTFSTGRNLPGDGNRDIYINLLRQLIHLMEPAYRSAGRARILAFVGLAGVGKTTTLAKLATRFSLYKKKKIALVAVQNYRIGAVKMLQAYGDFLGIPVDVVMDPSELARVLESHSDKDYIFIDTAGRSAQNTGQVLELKSFLDVVEEPRDVFLVLSAAAKNRDLMKAAYEFRRIGYSKLIFTKLDETETHGSILNLICALGIPVAYLTDGQEVPDNITEADPKKIAKLLLRGVDPL